MVKFSATTNGFYVDEFRERYELSGTLPADLVEVSEDDYKAYTGSPPKGKVLASVEGKPVWSDAPVVEMTPEEIAIQNLATANAEYASASNMISALNDQIADEDYTDMTEGSVKALLTRWTDYRKALRAYLKLADGSANIPVMADGGA